MTPVSWKAGETERLKVHEITDAKFVRHAVGRVGWRWTGTAPVGQCLLVGRGTRECESCTWNRRFCAMRDDAFCPDRSSCGPLSEDCGESRPVDSRVSGIVHEARLGVPKRPSVPIIDQSRHALTRRFVCEAPTSLRGRESIHSRFWNTTN